MIGLFLVWLAYFGGYLGTIIYPNGFNCSKKILEKQEIEKESKLNIIYFNKNAFPKLKILAYFNIIYVILNVIFTIAIIVLYNFNIDDNLLNIISFVYSLIFIFIGIIIRIVIISIK